MAEDEEISKLRSIIAKKDMEIASLQDALDKSQEFIVNIHQSLPLKIFRQYDSSLGKIMPIRPKKGFQSYKSKLIGKNTKIIQDLKKEPLTKMDVLYFPHIPWNYRFQRPHHILYQFAKQGHRIFFFTPILEKLGNYYEIDNLSENIYEVKISASRYFDIYKDKFDYTTLNSILKSFNQLRGDINLDPLCIVSFPTWAPLVLELKKQFSYKIIYDCVDNMIGFSNIHKARKNEETKLVENCDMVIASSKSLYEKNNKSAKKIIFVPNGVDYEYFHESRMDNPLKNFQKPIVGYFGAIAEWFDTDLIEFLSKSRPEINFVFIGDTYGSNLKKILNLKNVHFLGERPYSEIPKYLHRFDVCLIPFKITPLILDTHPIKIYEYFAAGKPVVVTKIPELIPMDTLCYVANDKKDFLEKLDKALNEDDEELAKKRMMFSSKNTWQDRFNFLYTELDKVVSLVLTSNK